MDHLLNFLLVAHLLTLLSTPFAILAAESISNNKSEIDMQALLDFKQGINDDPLGALSSWTVHTYFCRWSGVACGKALPLRVVSLELSSLGLSGQLSPSLANLTSIARLDLGNNSFFGYIPEGLGTLPKLQDLMLGYNNLSGGIPNSLATSSSLTVLDLATNRLSGLIPASLFNGSSRLVSVDLAANSFSGPIPDFQRMSTLRILSLGENNLSGSIPASLGNVSSLTIISLDLNALGGSIPESLGQIQNLETLTMSYNIIEGSIPASLANASKLQMIDLSENALAGPVPPLGYLPHLGVLNLGSNLLKSDIWAFIISITNCTNLTMLLMRDNRFDGSLPISVGHISPNLVRLDLGKNQIVGTLPAGIGNLSRLQLLAIDQNSISREFPSSVGNLRSLVVLRLSQNNLSGEITPAVGNLLQLSELSADSNSFSGKIPASLGQCKQLAILNLSVNNLDGYIPAQLFALTALVRLDLSKNHLTGSIPQQTGFINSLSFLNISYNNLSGQIPPSIGQCRTLSSLHMESNLLDGVIPESFVSLISIQEIDLSQNNLTGQIQDFVFYNFVALERLNLSYNNFEGPILTNGYFLKGTLVDLNGNTKLCSSVSLFALPICPTTSIVKNTNTHTRLLLIVIPPVTIALFSFLMFMITLLKKRTHTSPVYKETFNTSPVYKETFNAKAEHLPLFVQKKVYKETMKKVSYGDILQATNWLSPVNKISSSCTSSVYIGRFEIETDFMAIKVFHLDKLGSLNSFLMECEVLRNTRHRNLMEAVTIFSTVDLENNEFKAIAFDYMANGSLDMWVHKRGLNLGQRIRIAMDVASALYYMHNEVTPPLVHCDLKPANVLLDYDMMARVGDFGSAKFLSYSLDSFSGVGGTIGYIAPECGMGHKISTKSDVYSFGVLLLEMLTRKRPTDAMFTDGMSLHNMVSSAYPNGLHEVLDPYMSQGGDHAFAALTLQRYLIPLVGVALWSSKELPKNRPAMREVCAMLFEISEAFIESW